MTTGWIPEDNNTKRELKPIWEYRLGVEFVTILPDIPREFALLTGDLDPTGTWANPLSVWVHQFLSFKGDFATIVCDKWNEACPFCYENEIYKKQNPNYKSVGGRLPYGISKRGILQVWDFQENRVLWLLAGQQIVKGMDFILQKQAHMFKGYIVINRMGSKLNTSYRVDIGSGQLTDQHKEVIAKTMSSADSLASLMKMSHEEIIARSGVDPIKYFQVKIPQNHGVDISGWGAVPLGNLGGVPTPNIPPVNPTPPPVPPNVNQAPPPNIQQPQSSVVNPSVVVPEGIMKSLEEAVTQDCTIGMFVGKKLEEVIKQAGKPYIQYLLQTGQDKEKQACQILLDNWDFLDAFWDQRVPF